MESLDCSLSDSEHLSFSDSADDESVERRPLKNNPSLSKQSRTASVEGNAASNKAIGRLLRVQKSILKKRVKNLSRMLFAGLLSRFAILGSLTKLKESFL